MLDVQLQGPSVKNLPQMNPVRSLGSRVGGFRSKASTLNLNRNYIYIHIYHLESHSIPHFFTKCRYEPELLDGERV